jgi:hypothetical protein
MPITPLPTPPSRNDPTNFATEADAFLGALPAFQAEANALADDVNSKQIQVSNDAVDASNSADSASASAATASAAAASAVNAPGTGATSTTSNTISIGSKTFTIQTGKYLFPGQYVIIANTASPINYMLAQIQSYNSGTGALDVISEATKGSGTYTTWTISLTAPMLQPNDDLVALGILKFINF